MRIGTLVLIGICVASFHAMSEGGALHVGEVAIRGDAVSFPILLTGVPDDAVAGLDFILEHDPQTLNATGVRSGPVTIAANKSVAANMRSGLVNVVISGINQTTLAPGVIAEVQMRRAANAPGGATTLTIRSTTFTSPEADEIPSEGGSWTVDLPRRPGGNDGPGSSPDPGIGITPPSENVDDGNDDEEEDDVVVGLPHADGSEGNGEGDDPIGSEAERLARAMRDIDQIRSGMRSNDGMDDSLSANRSPNGGPGATSPPFDTVSGEVAPLGFDLAEADGDLDGARDVAKDPSQPAFGNPRGGRAADEQVAPLLPDRSDNGNVNWIQWTIVATVAAGLVGLFVFRRQYLTSNRATVAQLHRR